MQIIVLGMHRSGTSLVTRLFYEAGADLGTPETLYPGDRWNPDGYFEQPDIHAINMPLIRGAWGRLSYFALPSAETVVTRAGRYGTQIKETAARYQGKVVKDCRFCLTLPAWTAHGASIDRMLVCLRDPVAVMRSLQKRNRTTQKHAYKLWVLHNERLLQHAGDIPLWFVYYGNLFDEAGFLSEMKPAFNFFGIKPSEAELTALGRRFVKKQLNHSPDTEATYPEEVRTLWHAHQSSTLHDAVEHPL